MSIIEFKHVTKRYPESGEALSDVSFVIERGEMAFLTGHSGAGKSTLLRLIPVIERPTRGEIIIDGVPIHALQGRRIPYLRRKLGLIFQDYRLLNDRTIFDNVALPLLITGHNPQDIGRRVRAALDKVGLLRKEKRLPPALSGGEKQRVGIARAIVHKPPLILADEPTGNVDPEMALKLLRLFESLNRLGTTVVVATHDVHLIRKVPESLIMRLDKGRLSDPTGALRYPPRRPSAHNAL
jgi:cell division transport system ATP-binding protein